MIAFLMAGTNSCAIRSTAALILLLTGICAQALAARTVTDQLGRKVVVPNHPHRIICLLPSLVDDVYSLGAGNDVIGVPDFTRYPTAARGKPHIGLPLSPSLETIVALHPDLILGGADMNRAQTLSRLEQLGIPVFLTNTHGVQGIYASLQSLGLALNRRRAARQLVASLRRRVAAVRKQVRGKPPVQILMPLWYSPIITIGSRAYITQMIAIAGGHSVTSNIPQEWPQVSLEAIVARAPQALLLIRGSKVSLQAIRHHPGWSQVPAVRNHRVYYVGKAINYPSPVAFNALEEMAKEFHP